MWRVRARDSTIYRGPPGALWNWRHGQESRSALNTFGPRLDIGLVRKVRDPQKDIAGAHPPDSGFWAAVGSALAALARRTGSSASGCPLPEVREAARDIRELRHRQATEPDHRIAV
jgi:hypothetical protein